MKVNENTAVATAGVLLVPYDSHHVPTYHAWMEDEAIRAATASERLTLAEEYENQVSWRAAADKLTFILCQPLADERRDAPAEAAVVSGVDDAPDRMIGDINFFLYPWEDPADDENGQGSQRDGADGSASRLYSGEVDVMIARAPQRRQGFGRAAVTAFLHYILERQRASILAEAEAGAAEGPKPAPPQLKELMVKIQATNKASIGLFASLGFTQRGGVNYFGEVELVRTDLGAPAPGGYTERVYQRTGAL